MGWLGGWRGWLGRPAPVWRTRAVTVGLWLLVAGGPAVGLAALAADRPPSPTPARSTPPPAAAAEGRGVEGFARLFVARWLAGGELDPFYLDGGDRPGRPVRAWATHTAAVAVQPQTSGYWAVTVAAEVLEADPDGGWRAGGLRYFQVGVVDDDGGLVAAGLPAPTAPPTARSAPPLAAGRWGLPAGGPVEETAVRFLEALLTGSGPLDRYVTPANDVRAVDPPPYTTVRLVRTADAEVDGGRLLLVEAAAADTAGRTQLVQYALTLVQRDGRWEVATVHPAPPLEDRRL